MKKIKLISLLLILGILSSTIAGCGNSDGKDKSSSEHDSDDEEEIATKLTEYSGMVYCDEVDTAFYNVIDAAPVISIDALTGTYDEDDRYIFCDLDYSRYPETQWWVDDTDLTLSTDIYDVIIKITNRRGHIRCYSIQNILWVPELNLELTDTPIPVEYNLRRNDDAPIATSPENYKMMFADNIISKDQLAVDFSDKTYSEIVGKLGSIGLLQYLYLDGYHKDTQDIRIMWYCPEEEKILTLRFDGKNQALVGREVSNSNGEILESDIRMTTAEFNDVKARALEAQKEMEQAALEEEEKRLAKVNADRDANDADFSQISVGDVIKFGSFPFENKWDSYDLYADLEYVADCVYDENTKSYDENTLISRYITDICGVFNYGRYPNSTESMIEEDYPYKEAYYRLQKDHFGALTSIGDDEAIHKVYDDLVNVYSDDNGCYFGSIYPTYNDYVKVFNEDVELILSNCPNKMFDSYEDFKKIFERRVNEDLAGTYQPVEWDVLAIEDGKALLLSHNIIYNKPFFFDIDAKKYSYEDSELRVVLNGDLMDTMFNSKEKAKIVETNLKNDDGMDFILEYRKDDYSAGQSVPSKLVCNNTKDYMFLLSYDEIEKYYGEFEYLKGSDNPFTAYWLQHGYGHPELICTMANSNEPMGWWLRNANYGISGNNSTLLVDTYGIIINQRNIDGEKFGIRPAMWVSIDKERSIID